MPPRHENVRLHWSKSFFPTLRWCWRQFKSLSFSHIHTSWHTWLVFPLCCLHHGAGRVECCRTDMRRWLCLSCKQRVKVCCLCIHSQTSYQQTGGGLLSGIWCECMLLIKSGNYNTHCCPPTKVAPLLHTFLTISCVIPVHSRTQLSSPSLNTITALWRKCFLLLHFFHVSLKVFCE